MKSAVLQHLQKEKGGHQVASFLTELSQCDSEQSVADLFITRSIRPGCACSTSRRYNDNRQIGLIECSHRLKRGERQSRVDSLPLEARRWSGKHMKGTPSLDVLPDEVSVTVSVSTHGDAHTAVLVSWGDGSLFIEGISKS